MTTFRDTTFYRYHCGTKHTVAGLQADPHFLDWDNQPDPFRHYDGVALIDLPKPRRPAAADYFALRDAGGGGGLPVTLHTVSQLLYYSMAISAWKEVPGRGVRWALRVNPSSGNLHPTETHLLMRGVEGLADGCYHFRVDGFQLEQRYVGRVDGVLSVLGAACGAAWAPVRPVTVVLTSIFWREAWKYRGRAFRYCHHDMGHAIGAIVECARGLGLPCTFRHLFRDAQVASALGLAGGDEAPCALVFVGPDGDPCRTVPGAPTRFVGVANRLSDEEIEYPEIDAVYRATADWVPGEYPIRSRPPHQGESVTRLSRGGASDRDVWEVIRRRRSGVGFDGRTGISADVLGAILRRAMIGADGDVFNRDDDDGAGRFVHCYLYVHRVAGVEPGVYYYDRVGHALVLVLAGDQRRTAAYLSLGQAIAADSAFAVSMIGDFDAAYRCFGERGYRAMHVEAGLIGQGLYLGAESVGVNATGIGAFFDDDVNRYLSLADGCEVIYHFTVGGAVKDERLRTLPAYEWE